MVLAHQRVRKKLKQCIIMGQFDCMVWNLRRSVKYSRSAILKAVSKPPPTMSHDEERVSNNGHLRYSTVRRSRRTGSEAQPSILLACGITLAKGAFGRRYGGHRMRIWGLGYGYRQELLQKEMHRTGTDIDGPSSYVWLHFPSLSNQA